MSQKRNHIRIAVQRCVQLVSGKGRKANAKMINISDEGMGVLFSTPATAGMKIWLCFTLPAEQLCKQLCMYATVVHCHLSDNNYYIGFRFINLSKDQQAQLQDFIYLKQHQYMPAV